MEFWTLLAVVNFEAAKLPATADCFQLIEGEFGVGHGSVLCEMWWRSPSDAHTIAVIASRFLDLTQRCL